MNFALLRHLLVLIALLGALPLHAQPVFPKLTGRVVDAANIIPPDREAALDAKLKALEDNSTRQLVVATIPDLGDYDIADYGYQLGRAWGIGQKAENNGALLIVAPNQRRVRIEVGYGLEGIVTDALSSVIINQQITPRFKAGDYPGGIDAGVDALATQLTLPPDQARARAARVQPEPRRVSGGFNAGSLIFWGFILIFVLLPMLRGGRRGRRYRRSGLGEAILWSTVLNSGRGGGSGWGGGGFGGGGGFSGGGGSFGGGGASGGW